MSKNRLLKLIIGTAIILAAFVALQAFRPSGDEALYSSGSYVGMGDLRYFEAQAVPNSGALEGSATYAGMGDLRRFEAQAVPNSGALEWSATYAGMGDLRRFEAQQFLPNTVTRSSISP